MSFVYSTRFAQTSLKKALIGSLALAALRLPARAEAQIDLKQNWTSGASERFGATDQGSRIISYKWSLHLKQANGCILVYIITSCKP
jgi:hypothetical protein